MVFSRCSGIKAMSAPIGRDQGPGYFLNLLRTEKDFGPKWQTSRTKGRGESLTLGGLCPAFCALDRPAQKASGVLGRVRVDLEKRKGPEV